MKNSDGKQLRYLAHFDKEQLSEISKVLDVYTDRIKAGDSEQLAAEAAKRLSGPTMHLVAVDMFADATGFYTVFEEFSIRNGEWN